MSTAEAKLNWIKLDIGCLEENAYIFSMFKVAEKRAREKHELFPNTFPEQLQILLEEIGEACQSENDNLGDLHTLDELFDIGAVLIGMIRIRLLAILPKVENETATDNIKDFEK